MGDQTLCPFPYPIILTYELFIIHPKKIIGPIGLKCGSDLSWSEKPGSYPRPTCKGVKFSVTKLYLLPYRHVINSKIWRPFHTGYIQTFNLNIAMLADKIVGYWN